MPDKKIHEVVAELVPKAAALWQSEALQPVVDQLVRLNHAVEAISLVIHAAAQLDPSQSLVDVLFGTGLGTEPFPGASDFFAQKKAIVGRAISILEQLWQTNRAGFDKLLGAPNESTGLIWNIQPTDQVCHWLLFDWLQRAEPEEVRDYCHLLLVSSTSLFLEVFINRLPEEFTSLKATYLRRRKHDYAGAMRLYAEMTNSQLSYIAPAKRLDARLYFVGEAISCAQEARLPELRDLESQREHLGSQRKLVQVLDTFRKEDAAKLPCAGFASREAFATASIERLRADALDGRDLFDLAAPFRFVGAADIQLEVLQQHKEIEDPLLWAEVLTSAFEQRTLRRQGQLHLSAEQFSRSPEFVVTVREAVRDLAARFFEPRFPLDFMISYAESLLSNRTDAKAPVAEALLEAKVDWQVIATAYFQLLLNPETARVVPSFREQVSQGALLSAMDVVLANVSRSRTEPTAVFELLHQFQAVADQMPVNPDNSERLQVIRRWLKSKIPSGLAPVEGYGPFISRRNGEGSAY